MAERGPLRRRNPWAHRALRATLRGKIDASPGPRVPAGDAARRGRCHRPGAGHQLRPRPASPRSLGHGLPGGAPSPAGSAGGRHPSGLGRGLVPLVAPGGPAAPGDPAGVDIAAGLGRSPGGGDRAATGGQPARPPPGRCPRGGVRRSGRRIPAAPPRRGRDAVRSRDDVCRRVDRYPDDIGPPGVVNRSSVLDQPGRATSGGTVGDESYLPRCSRLPVVSTTSPDGRVPLPS